MRLSPRISLPPPLWRESRVGFELAALLRDPVLRGEGVSDGRGQPVLLVPGFLAGDDSLRLMFRWLGRNGYHPVRAGVRLNVGCSGDLTGRLERLLEQAVEKQGRRAAIVGQSRGGHFAKVLARRRPDLVSGVVTLGSPQLDPLAINPLVWLQVVAVGALGTLGARGLFKRGCLDGECCADFWVDCSAELAANVGYVSVYSRSDGVVDWRSCLDPDADQVEISSSHIGMAAHPESYRAIAGALARFRRREARRGRATAPVARIARAA
jgi:pimeloyl-ACP methyl ester carboxylesterase